MDDRDLHRPLAERRKRREHRQLPKRFRDIAPEPPAALPPASLQVMLERTQPDSNIPHPPSQQVPVPVPLVRRVLSSVPNIHGLFRQYYATRFPDHDPGEHITRNDLITPPDPSSAPPTHNHVPYPNQSLFFLENGIGMVAKKNLNRAFKTFSR